MHSIYKETPIELVFPPQVPFIWTLRGAHARRLRAQRLKESRLIEATDSTLSSTPSPDRQSTQASWPRRSPTATSTAQASSFTDHADRARREDECEHPLAYRSEGRPPPTDCDTDRIGS
jgi:hypothetical protein